MTHDHFPATEIDTRERITYDATPDSDVVPASVSGELPRDTSSTEGTSDSEDPYEAWYRIAEQREFVNGTPSAQMARAAEYLSGIKP
jgi:hypothetical protein